jgi:hypothetical protein
MKEKYKFGYSDPRAMYGSQAVELEEPEVKWDFLEPHNDNEWLAKLPWFGAAILVLLVLL